MNCQLVMTSIGTYLDGSLDATQDAAIEDHIATCPTCAAAAGRAAEARCESPDLARVLAAVAATGPSAAPQSLLRPKVDARRRSAIRRRHAFAATVIALLAFSAGWFVGQRPASDVHAEAAQVLDLMRHARPVADAVTYRAAVPGGASREITFAAGGRRLDEEKRDQAVVSVGVVSDGLAWTFVPGERRLRVAESRPPVTPDLFDPPALARVLESAFEATSVREETIGGTRCRVLRARPRAGGDPIAVAVDADSGVIRRVEAPAGAGTALVLDLVGACVLDVGKAFSLWDYASKAAVVDCDWRDIHLAGVPAPIFVQTMVSVIHVGPGSPQSLDTLPPEIQRAVREAVRQMDPEIRSLIERKLGTPASRPEH